MNELLFLFHATIVIVFGLGALRLGKVALTTWTVLQAILANLFVLKQIHLLGFHVTCSDVYAIGSVLGMNLLREYYGKEVTKQALIACFYAMVFFVAMSQLHLLYIPSHFDTAHVAFQMILATSPRLLFASIATFFLVQQIDIHLFSKLKIRYASLSLSTRNALCLTCTQGLDTVLFSFLGLWGLVAHLEDIICISFLLKLLLIALLTPLTYFSKRYTENTSISGF